MPRAALFSSSVHTASIDTKRTRRGSLTRRTNASICCRASSVGFRLVSGLTHSRGRLLPAAAVVLLVIGLVSAGVDPFAGKASGRGGVGGHRPPARVGAVIPPPLH